MERTMHLEVADQIVKAAGPALEPVELFQAAVREIRRAVPCERCLIASVDPETKNRTHWHVDSEVEMGPHMADPREVEEWFWREVYETKRPRNIPDLETSAFPDAARLLKAGLRSMLAVPILQDEQCLAHLNLLSTRTGAFTEADEELLAAVGIRLGAAMQNLPLHQVIGKGYSRLLKLNELSQMISQNLDVAKVLEALARAFVELLDAELSRIFLWDEETQEYRLRAFCSRLSGALPPKETYRPGEGLLGKVAADGKPLIVGDVQRNPDTASIEWTRKEGIRSFLLQPILNEGKVVGVVNCSSRKKDLFLGENLDLVKALASQAGIAIQNAKLHEEARRSRDFFRSIVDESADAILVTNRERGVILWNAAAEELYGYAKEEVFGQDIEMLIPPEQRAQWAREISDPIRKADFPEPARFEADRLRKDGTQVPVSVTVSPITGKDGELLAVSIIHRDLTEHRRAKEELKKTASMLRGLIDASPLAVVTTDFNGLVTSWNPAAEQVFGWSAEEAIGDPPPFVTEEHRAEFRFNLKKTLEGRSIRGAVIRRRKKDGSPICLNLYSTAVWGEAGEPIGVMGIFEDITEQMRAQEDRERYLEQLRRLNALTRKIGSTLDIDEVLDFVVRSAAQLLDFPYVGCFLVQNEKLVMHSEYTNSIPGQNLPELALGEGLGGRVAATGEVLYVEEVLKDPRWRSADWARQTGAGSYWGVPLKKDGEVKGVLSCVTRGIRRPGERELELLEAFGNEAAIAIENAESHARLQAALEELRQSQAMLIRTEKLSSLGVLAAGAAHEILNPATVIGLRAQKLAELSVKDGESVQMAKIILENVHRIAHICEDLRRFSRDEKPSTRRLDLAEVIRKTASLLGHELRLGAVAPELNFSCEPVSVKGDPNQLQQVFVNLFTNAIDAMPEGGRLSVSCRETESGGRRWWEIRVADTGPGIPEEILPRIFDPFFTTKPQHRGTGLGLSVSLGLIESHGGTIWAESPPGEGATFIIRLPVLEEKG